MYICISGKNFNKDGNQKITHAVKTKFSFDFGLFFTILRRFLPLGIVFDGNQLPGCQFFSGMMYICILYLYIYTQYLMNTLYITYYLFFLPLVSESKIKVCIWKICGKTCMPEMCMYKKNVPPLTYNLWLKFSSSLVDIHFVCPSPHICPSYATVGLTLQM